MDFIDTHFGRCQRCGQDGRDQTDGLTSADTPASETTGNGVLLEKHEERYVCVACKAILESEKEDLQSAEYRRAEESFRSRIGFTNQVV